MGKYLNPSTISKEMWLMRHATPRFEGAPKTLADLEKGVALACLVDNRHFFACAYVFDEIELERFKEDTGGRVMLWYTLPKSLAETNFR